MTEPRAYDPTIYQGAAAHYRPGRPPYSPELEATLTRELRLDGHGRLLDVGCGGGLFLRMMRERGCAVLGLDSDIRAAAQAWNQSGVPALVGSLESAPLPPASCAAVTSMMVLAACVTPLTTKCPFPE